MLELVDEVDGDVHIVVVVAVDPCGEVVVAEAGDDVDPHVVNIEEVGLQNILLVVLEAVAPEDVGVEVDGLEVAEVVGVELGVGAEGGDVLADGGDLPVAMAGLHPVVDHKFCCFHGV